MKIKYHGRNKFYHASQVDETNYSSVVYERLKKLESYDDLMHEGTEETIVLKALNVSRATLYRWKKRYKYEGLSGLEIESRKPKKCRKPTWSQETADKVFALRKEFPAWGKYKITVLYKKRYGEKIAVSMVGRIISSLLKLGKIKSVAFLTGQKEVKPRNFDGHAKPWTPRMQAEKPGELMQVDHTNPRLPSGWMIKHFKLTCPITKISVEHVYERATSNNARDFLVYAQQKLPFPIISIQVDGGSEFMGEFEAACQEQDIGLYVLPPRSPEYNGCVERSNRTVKREFYSFYEGPSNLKTVQTYLEKFGEIYNNVRPHQALRYLTPMEYFNLYRQKEAL